MSPVLACRTVRDLIFKDICYIRDIFQYSNRYAVTPKLQHLYRAFIQEKMNGNPYSKSVVMPFLDAIRLDKKVPGGRCIRSFKRNLEFSEGRPSFYDVFRFLCSLSSPDLTQEDEDRRLRDVLLEHSNVRKLCDIKKLVEFATREGWIRRLHEYPAIIIGHDETRKVPEESAFATGAKLDQLVATIKKQDKFMFVSSEYSLEEVCAAHKTSEQERTRKLILTSYYCGLFCGFFVETYSVREDVALYHVMASPIDPNRRAGRLGLLGSL